MMDPCVYWLWLVLVFGPAEQRIWILGRDMGNAQEFYEALKSGRVPQLTARESERAAGVSLEAAEKLLEQCREEGTEVLCYESEDYPDKLRQIANPPAVLFVRGSLGLLRNRSVIGFAGTRSPSEYSRKAAAYLVKRLCEKGCVIATGLSDGIDLLSSNTAAESGSPSVGIYGLAIDQFEAGDNADPAKGGLLISETHSAMGCPRPKFSYRNRIITALCDAVVFVEGSLSSRGLELCMQCIAKGRLLFVVPPHDITDRRYKGQSWLIRRGCRPVFSEKDVLYHISRLELDRVGFDTADGLADAEDYSFFVDEVPHFDKERKRTAAKPARGSGSSETKKDSMRAEQDISQLDETDAGIYALLKNGPMLADEISARIDTDIAETLSRLTMLELDGYIISYPGNRFGIV